MVPLTAVVASASSSRIQAANKGKVIALRDAYPRKKVNAHALMS